MFKNKLYPIVFVLLIAGLVLAACGTGNQPAPTVGPIQAAGTAAMSTIEAAVAANRAAAEQATADSIMSGAAGTAAALTGGAIPSTETPMPGATAPVSVAPTTGPSDGSTTTTAGNCDYANLVVPATAWTNWLPADNKVCENAYKVRPQPFEANVPASEVNRAIQLATRFDDTNPSGTLEYGAPSVQHEYDLPSGYRPVFQATQSDAVVKLRLCWMREERDGNIATLETQILAQFTPHNGGSALITLIPVAAGDVPPIGTRCPSGE